MASTALQSPYFPRGTVALGAASPLFTWFILTRVSLYLIGRSEVKVTDQKVSGVPPLERHGNRKWGDDPKWQEYKRCVYWASILPVSSLTLPWPEMYLRSGPGDPVDEPKSFVFRRKVARLG